MNARSHRLEHGFTLVEVAIVLLVLAILSGGVLLTVRAQLGQKQLADTRAALDEARAALLAFATTHGRLPCAALESGANAGRETLQSVSPVSCLHRRGVLPWQTLGISARDGWGRPLAYLVAEPFIDAAALRTDFTDEQGRSNISVLSGGANSTPVVDAHTVAFVLWSLGENGRQNLATPGDERSNDPAAATETVVFRDDAGNPAAPGGAFDDRLVWVSRYVLFDRLLTAGKLP